MKNIKNFTYALLTVVSFITALGFITAGIEVFLATGTDYIPFIKLARECSNDYQGGALIFTGMLAGGLMAIVWIAWNDEESIRY